MSFPKRLHFPPPSPPTNVVPWYLAFPWALPADSLDPYVLKRSPQPARYRLLHGLFKCRRLRPGSIAVPEAGPRVRAGLSAVAPNSPPRRALALRPAAGGMRASRVHPPRRFWGPGLDVLPPERSAGRCRAGPGGAVHLYAPGGRRLRPRPAAGRASRGASEAGLSSPARRGAEPPRSSAGGASFPRPLRLAPLFSRRGRSDLQRSRGARSDRIGAAPPGPATGAGRGAPRRAGPLCTAR